MDELFRQKYLRDLVSQSSVANVALVRQDIPFPVDC